MCSPISTEEGIFNRIRKDRVVTGRRKSTWQRHQVCSESSEGFWGDGQKSNSGEEAGKALWVWSVVRIFPMGSGAPVLVTPITQSSGAHTLDPGSSGAAGDQCRCHMKHALSSTAPGGHRRAEEAAAGQVSSSCEQRRAQGTAILSSAAQRSSLASGPGGMSLTARGSFPCNDLM